QCLCIALQEDAAETAEISRVGPRQRERVADACGLRPEYRVLKNTVERRFESEGAFGVERLQRKPELGGNFHLGRERTKTFFAAIDFEPACLAEISCRIGLAHQRFVLRHGAREQWADQSCGLGQTLRLRGRTERKQPGNNLRQKRGMIAGFARALERNTQKRVEIGRKCRRKYRVTLDNACISV